MANLIQVNTFTKLGYQDETVTTAVPLVLNVKKIISVSVRASTVLPTGVTTILYEFPYNQMTYQKGIIVTETVAAVLAAANADPA